MTTTTERLSGRVAVITGGASGFGAAISKSFADAGAAVIVADLNLAGARDIAQSILSRGGRAESVQADISRADAFPRMIELAENRFGPVNVVVNNAGYASPIESMADTEEETFDRLFKVNVKGLYWSIKAFVPVMQRAGGGVFINIASMSAVRPRPGIGWYAASKGAVVIATKSLAVELASSGIRVCAINPATAETPIAADFLAGSSKRDQVIASIPLGRLCTVADIADAAVFLASDEASFLTGTILDVDGGRAI